MGEGSAQNHRPQPVGRQSKMKQTNKQTIKQTNNQTNKQSNKQTIKDKTNKQTAQNHCPQPVGRTKDETNKQFTAGIGSESVNRQMIRHHFKFEQIKIKQTNQGVLQ